jgi:hypothetical protein
MTEPSIRRRQPVIDDGEGARRVAQIERLQFEMEDDTTRFDRIEATFAVME